MANNTVGQNSIKFKLDVLVPPNIIRPQHSSFSLIQELFKNCSNCIFCEFQNFSFFRFCFIFWRFIQYRGEKRGKLLKRGNSIFDLFQNLQSESANMHPVWTIYLDFRCFWQLKLAIFLAWTARIIEN